MANKTLDRMTRSAISRMFQVERRWRAPRHRSALRSATRLMKILTLLFLASVLLCTGCRESNRTSDFDAEWEKRTRAQMDDFDRQTKRVDELQTKMDEQNKRFDKILEKWEEQARRYDAILKAMEKQQGVKK
jgi:hypothetical protein